MVETISKALPRLEINTSGDLIRLARVGMKVEFLSDIMTYTGMSNKELATALPISERQLIRYIKGDLLRGDITERLLKLVALYAEGYELFGERAYFQNWMRSKLWALGGETPMSLLDTSIGLQEVRNIIGRLAWGVYS